LPSCQLVNAPASHNHLPCQIHFVPTIPLLRPVEEMVLLGTAL
jgi:hypothetical protein